MDSKQHGIIVDLNRYRPGRSLKKMMDAGVSGFILRMGGPSQWVEGDWRYKEDETWRGYFDQAKALGIEKQIGGYIVHNPFEEWRLQGIISNVHLNLINSWTSGGYMPGYIIVDHEVATCWRGATKITCTPYNLVASLTSITDQIWKLFKKVPVIYTARWFIDNNGPSDHATFLDNVNKADKVRPMWYAWYPVGLTKTYQNAGEILTEIATPTAAQVGKYLQCGSYSAADLVQFTDRLKLAGVMLDGSNDTAGVDASWTFDTVAKFFAGVNVTTTVEPPPPPPATTGGLSAEQAAAMKAELAAATAAIVDKYRAE